MTQILTASGYKSIEDPIRFYNSVAEEREVEVLVDGKRATSNDSGETSG